MSRSWLLGMMLVLVLASCGKCGGGCTEQAAPTEPVVVKKPVFSGPKLGRKEEWLTCAQDSDCVTMPADCCGCNAGGIAMAINANAVEQAKAARADKCGGVMCAQLMSSHHSCKAAPRCESGKCVLPPPVRMRAEEGVGIEKINRIPMEPALPEKSEAPPPQRLE